MKSQQLNKRIIYYDFLKLVAACMVVFYHLGTISFGIIDDTLYFPNINRIIMNLCQISVPIFFMVNGGLLLNKNINKSMIYKSIKLIIIYIIWSKLIGGITEIINMDNVRITSDFLIKTIIHNDYSLWFLKTLSILYFLYPLIKWIYDRENEIYLKIMLYTIFIFPFLYNYVILIFKVFNIEKYNLNMLPRTGFFTLYSILYFTIGGLLSKDIKNRSIFDRTINKAIALIIVGLALSTLEGIIMTNINKSMFDGVNSSFPTIGALLMSIGVFYTSSKMRIKQNGYVHRFIEFIGKNSMGVYIFHLPLVCIVKNIIGITTQTIYDSFFTAICITILSASINSIIKKVPIINWTIKI